ncbi:MAG: HAMP domain-containing histidine kinase [Anaerolineaceae bacterium]|nr:HAMP domain-containing histidine kinase [Anaerolineaceae bacterium]
MGDKIPAYLVRPASDTSESLWLHVEQLAMTSDTTEKYLVNLQDVTEDINTKRLMWTFHAQIGHKLRTPIMLISGSLDMLHADKNILCNDHQVLVSSAYKNALRLQSEIQDVLQYLDISHIATPGDEICNINKISEIVETIKSDLNLKAITLELDENITSSSPPLLPLSPRAVEIILQELLENSQKFHPHQAPLIEVNISKYQGQICIKVLDDGLNLQPEQLTKIWSPYYQIERYFTGQITGMGLGLASVASLVWDVGGTCRAFNRSDGPGLVIELVLPLKERL